MAQTSSSGADGSRFANLRGVRWRMNLGILPASPDATVDDIRRVTADSRRRYAILRRQLLMDPKFHKDGSRSPDLTMDNPLSQNPDSMWGRFFQNAELEKLVDQDLSRLYPEEGSYFQSQPFQTMLRRIILSWSLRHPEYGYRQGMHELMAPLLYVLHMDMARLSEVRRLYEDQFNDEFDGKLFAEDDVMSKYGIRKNSSWDDEEVQQGSMNGSDARSSREVDPETREIILLNDAYGTEGELGIVLSERFMEHDAYCMFDALMNGSHGVVAIADFFSPTPSPGSASGLSPVIEASSALYHLLSAVDSPLHCHLVELGVEPQYFALRWLRVLFGREFSLQNLLITWDEIFSSPNEENRPQELSQVSYRILSCQRGAFIAALAVSMILHIRSSLFATENITVCLQRLLNFPQNVDLKKLIEKARSLQDLAMDIEMPADINVGPVKNASTRHTRHYSVSTGSVSPATPRHPPPDSYWEDKWRVLHPNSGEKPQRISNGGSSGRRKSPTTLLKTQSDMSPVKNVLREDSLSEVRRRLFDDSPPSVSVNSKVEEDGSVIVDPPTVVNAEETFSSPLSRECSASLSGEDVCETDGMDADKSNDDGKEAAHFPDVEIKAEKVVPVSGRFHWLWKLGRGGDESSSKNGTVGPDAGAATAKDVGWAEFRDKRMMGTLKNLGQTMLDNIQVLESAFQKELGGQAAAMTALKELRKISHRLFEIDPCIRADNRTFAPNSHRFVRAKTAGAMCHLSSRTALHRSHATVHCA